MRDKISVLYTEERIARRSPTLDGVMGWIQQARSLPPLVR